MSKRLLLMQSSHFRYTTYESLRHAHEFHESLRSDVNIKHLMHLRKIVPQARNTVNKMLGNPAGERNKQPILEVLQKYIDTERKSNLLEISSGFGLHASFFGERFPNVIYQTSEFEPGVFNSINAYRANCKTKNVLPPVFIDISQDLATFEGNFQEKPLKDCQNTFDYMLNINMMHISPYNCSEGLFANSSKLLKTGGLLFTYGPYANEGVLEPESNVSFNISLRCRNSLWGVRDIADLKKLAASNSMELHATYDLPSNNKCLVWKKI